MILKQISLITAASVVAMTFVVADQAKAATIGFDDLSNESSIYDGYHGFNWDNLVVLNANDFHNKYGDNGYTNGLVSGNNVAFNTNGMVGLVNGQSFTFNGAYLTAAWNDNLNITVEGLLDGITKYTKTVVVNTDSPNWFNFDFQDINGLQFTSFGGTDAGFNGSGTHFAMDNFTYNEPTQYVPEPITGLVLAAGMGGAALGRAKSKKR